MECTGRATAKPGSSVTARLTSVLSGRATPLTVCGGQPKTEVPRAYPGTMTTEPLCGAVARPAMECTGRAAVKPGSTVTATLTSVLSGRATRVTACGGHPKTEVPRAYPGTMTTEPQCGAVARSALGCTGRATAKPGSTVTATLTSVLSGRATRVTACGGQPKTEVPRAYPGTITTEPLCGAVARSALGCTGRATAKPGSTVTARLTLVLSGRATPLTVCGG